MPRIEEMSCAIRLVLSGEAGLHEADPLHLALTRLLATHPKLTIVDLTECTMLASVTLGALLSYKSGLLKNSGRKLLLAKATFAIRFGMRGLVKSCNFTIR